MDNNKEIRRKADSRQLKANCEGNNNDLTSVIFMFSMLIKRLFSQQR